MGSSAGGHLAALAAVTQAKDGFEPTDDGLGDVSSAVQACVTYYGPHDWSTWGGKRGKDTPEDIEKGRQASTITHLDKDDPPTLVFHGNKDITVRYAQSQILAAKLKEVGVPHEFITIEGKGHGTFYEPRKSGLNDHALVTWFLGKHLEGKDEPKPDAAVGSPPRPAP
jgi:acetyl esterase/lipase